MTKRAIVAFTLSGMVAASCGGIRNLGGTVDAAADARRADASVGADARLLDAPASPRPTADANLPDAPDVRRDAAPADTGRREAGPPTGSADASAADASAVDAKAADASAADVARPDVVSVDAPVPDSALPDSSPDTSSASDGEPAPTPDGSVDAMVVATCPPGISLEMLCATYCGGITAYCAGPSAQFASEADCLAACTRPTWSCGAPGQTTGDTVFCRATHLGFAIALPPSAPAECSNAGPDSPTCR
jgi:hypothetical protein